MFVAGFSIFSLRVHGQAVNSRSKLIGHPTLDSGLRTTPWVPNLEPDSIPSDFPVLAITKLNNPGTGDLYLANFRYIGDQYGTYLMILDSYGHLIYKHRLTRGAQDFRLQPNGHYTYFDLAAKKFYGMDSNFIIVDTFAAKGHETDSHELRILPNGGYALFGVYSETVDMRPVIPTGDSAAVVIFNDLQEFDKDKNLIFDWRTNDPGHFAITDATNEDLTLHTIDAVHCNSIELDRDSTFLISSRSLDEVTKIDRKTGAIIWRLGGKHNQFTYKNDSLQFMHQHDVRRLPNGNITMFDNGNFRKPLPYFSRAVEYTINEDAKTITKIWDYRHDPDVFAGAMGSVQRRKDGSTLIGWGISDTVAVTEVKPDGSTAFEMALPSGHFNYRAYKFTKDEFSADVEANTIQPYVTLNQNYPNPFSSSSTISFSTDKAIPVKLEISDAFGRITKILFDGRVDAGNYSAKFEAENLPNGMYIFKLTTPTTWLSKTMILLK